MRRLFIAEKPSLARAIVEALPQPHVRKGAYYECGAGDVVTWCAGHILEPSPPDAYNPDFKTWRLDDLPIVPESWKLQVSAPDLLKNIKALLPTAERVVHAGDPDREGQLLVDEILVYLGYRGAVDRLLISDLSPLAVTKALTALRPNDTFRALYHAALARQRADWLFGMNMTRLYTVLGRNGGYDGVLSVGRVQTPLLGLIVRRDLEIEKFQPRPYFVVKAAIDCEGGGLSATWKPSDEAKCPVDESGRLLNREDAVAIRAKVSGREGRVTLSSRERKTEEPPLPYSLPTLQVDAAKQYGLSPKDTLDACQALYETHRLITYPRSDCSYLPEGQFDQATGALAAVATNISSLVPLIGRADRSRRSRAWNDAKVAAHHAIIPTLVARPDADLSAGQRAIYELVARRYLAQFYPSAEFDERRIELLIEGELFRASRRQLIVEGWRVVIAELPEDGDTEGLAPKDDEDDSIILPVVRDAETVLARKVTISDRQTTPPKRFTNASLIQAMTGIARYVTDPRINQLLREADGIGTPATQAQIIQTLYERGFIENKRRHIVSTAIGRTLVHILPEIATKPDMTALWEAAMRRIAEGTMPLSTFLGGVVNQLGELVQAGRSLSTLSVPGALPCPATGCSGTLRRRRGQYGPFWACVRYPECRYTAEDPAGGRRRQPRRASGQIYSEGSPITPASGGRR